MGAKQILTDIGLAIVVIAGNLPMAARVGNKFDCSNEEADMVLTITSEDPKEVEITEYTPKDGWPLTLIIPGTVTDEERNEEFSVTSIGPNVYADAPIRKVVFPKSMKKLGRCAFYDSLLLGVDLRGIEEVGDYCFGFGKLQPNEDGNTATFFSGCLQYVVLGSSVRELGRDVFEKQEFGKTIVCYSPEPPLMEPDMMEYWPAGHITYVPVGSIPAYVKAQDEGRWYKKTTFFEFPEDLLLCAGSAKNQDRYYNDNPILNDFKGTALRTHAIGHGVPCVVSWTLCEVDDEYSAQPDPEITWTASNKAEITDEGIVTGIEAGSAVVKCKLTLNDPEVTGTADIPFTFYDPASGIGSISVDTTFPERIYNLNGIEITGGDPGHGVFIRVSGDRTEKIVR